MVNAGHARYVRPIDGVTVVINDSLCGTAMMELGGGVMNGNGLVSRMKTLSSYVSLSVSEAFQVMLVGNALTARVPEATATNARSGVFMRL